MQTLILDPFSPWALIGSGIVLVALEIMITSFVVIWFGFGFIITGLLTYIITFEDGMWQLALSSIIAATMLLMFRTIMIDKYLNYKETINEDFLNSSGVGIISNGKVKFKATYWDIEKEDETELTEGMRVDVISTSNGIAKIKKRDM